MTLTLLKITGELFCRVSLTLGFSDVSSWRDSNLVSVGISQKRDYILLMACYQVADDFELLSLSIKKTFLKNQTILAVHGTKFVIYPGQENGYKNTLWSKSFSGERPLPWYQIPFLEWKLSSGGGSDMWLTPNICSWVCQDAVVGKRKEYQTITTKQNSSLKMCIHI